MVLKQVRLEQPKTNKKDIYEALFDRSIKVQIERTEQGDQVTLVLPLKVSFLIPDGDPKTLVGPKARQAEKSLFKFALEKLVTYFDR